LNSVIDNQLGSEIKLESRNFDFNEFPIFKEV
jgi:hypothetical protein